MTFHMCPIPFDSNNRCVRHDKEFRHRSTPRSPSRENRKKKIKNNHLFKGKNVQSNLVLSYTCSFYSFSGVEVLTSRGLYRLRLGDEYRVRTGTEIITTSVWVVTQFLF